MKVPAPLAAAAAAKVDQIMGHVGVIAVVISTTDGFDVAARVESTAKVSNLAALGSSIAAIASAVTEESRVGGVESLAIGAADGHVLVVGVAHPQHPLTVNVVAQKSAVLGQVLYATRQCALDLARV